MVSLKLACKYDKFIVRVRESDALQRKIEKKVKQGGQLNWTELNWTELTDWLTELNLKI